MGYLLVELRCDESVVDTLNEEVLQRAHRRHLEHGEEAGVRERLVGRGQADQGELL